jgi:glycosyltransferase involved in cell wall biosynthesis
VPHDQLGGYLARADVMVHLSPAETFGIAPLEAIGSGLPVVSLRNAGAVNTWGDIAQECGLLLPLEASPKEIAEAISELARSTTRLQPAVGRQAVLDRYSPGVVAGRLMATYAEVLR